MNIPTRLQINEAIAAFLDEVRRGQLTYEELLDPGWLEKPMLYALQAAEKDRPAVLQDELAVDRDTRGLAFRVEVWTRDELQVEEVIGAGGTYLVALAAYEAAIKARSTNIVLLRRGGHVLEEYRPPHQGSRSGDGMAPSKSPRTANDGTNGTAI
jgi:hypothetical protein